MRCSPNNPTCALAAVPGALDLGALQALLAFRLLTAIEPGFGWSSCVRLLAERDKPLRQVRGIRRAVRHRAYLNSGSLALADALAALRAGQY